MLPHRTRPILPARQAEMQVVLAPDLATNVTPSAVYGRLAAGDALAALLKGTGFSGHVQAGLTLQRIRYPNDGR